MPRPPTAYAAVWDVIYHSIMRSAGGDGIGHREIVRMADQVLADLKEKGYV